MGKKRYISEICKEGLLKTKSNQVLRSSTKMKAKSFVTTTGARRSITAMEEHQEAYPQGASVVGG